MYTDKNYPSKKALLTDLKAGVQIHTHAPGGFHAPQLNGTVCLEGPHYPQPHRWYATAVIKDGYVVSAK
jgi:hypothetical protein